MTDIIERTEAKAERFNLDFERILLGSLMGNPGELARVQETGLESGDFYKPAHAILYATICAAIESRQPIEPFALAEQLAKQGTLAKVGGGAYLHDLLSSVITSTGQVVWYARQLVEMAQARQVVAEVTRVEQAARAGADPERLAAMAQNIARVAAPRSSDVGMVSLGEFAQLGIRDIEMRKDAPPGLTTGLIDLDTLLGGLRPGQLVMIAGLTGSGKSTFAMDFARRNAISERRVVAWFSGEMPTQELFDRCLSAQARILYDRVRDGLLDEEDWRRASKALGPMSEAPLFFDDKGGMTVSRIANNCRRLHAKVGLDAVIIDHIGLVRGSGRAENRNQDLGAIIRDTKDMALSLNVPVLALCQENRSASGRTDKAPQLTDIRDSGEVEQSADIVIMLHRDDYYDAESPRAGEVDFYVRKHRRGSLGVATAAAQLHLCRFVDMAIEPARAA